MAKKDYNLTPESNFYIPLQGKNQLVVYGKKEEDVHGPSFLSFGPTTYCLGVGETPIYKIFLKDLKNVGRWQLQFKLVNRNTEARRTLTGEYKIKRKRGKGDNSVVTIPRKESRLVTDYLKQSVKFS